MQTTLQNGIIKITAEMYTLVCPADRPYVYLEDAAGRRLAELFIHSSVNTLHGRDDALEASAWEVSEEEDETLLSLSTCSSIWQRKTYRFRCLPRRLLYEVEVEGSGHLCEVDYFGGYYSGQTRWGSGFFWSGQHFLRGFNPEPNKHEANYFQPAEGATINLIGVPLPGKDDWFFTPPPFCFAFDTGQGWLGAGIEARPGDNRFTEFSYHGQSAGFFLSLSYEGYTRVAGRCRLPAVALDFAGDEYGALAAHVAALQAAGYVPISGDQEKCRPSPSWWQGPIFCGWGAQCYLADMERGKSPDYARQALYEGFLTALDAHGIDPGIIVLDDKWQASYGENQVDEAKWPDLPGFIRSQHARGRKVLLWLKAWDPEGVPVEECITNANGSPLAVDPTNPQFEQRLRHSVKRMLSSGGYGADGLKIDFTARIPSGPGIRAAGDAWGLELMKCYLGIIYDEAKRAKPDALVMTHTPHPYLADVVDMIRLNDMNDNSDVNQAMIHRWKVARIACPAALIDTDNWPVKDKATWRRYVTLQPELGVPSLYFATHIDATQEPLDEDDYRLVREVWARHRLAHGIPAVRPARGLEPWVAGFASAGVP